MRLLSVKGLILAVALAAQAFIALEGSAAMGERGGGASICEQQRRHLTRPLPDAPPGRDPAACFSCQLCLDGFAPVPTHFGAAHHISGFAGALIVWPPLAGVPTRSTIAWSHRARAPPAIA